MPPAMSASHQGLADLAKLIHGLGVGAGEVFALGGRQNAVLNRLPDLALEIGRGLAGLARLIGQAAQGGLGGHRLGQGGAIERTPAMLLQVRHDVGGHEGLDIGVLVVRQLRLADPRQVGALLQPAAGLDQNPRHSRVASPLGVSISDHRKTSMSFRAPSDTTSHSVTATMG